MYPVGKRELRGDVTFEPGPTILVIADVTVGGHYPSWNLTAALEKYKLIKRGKRLI
jgi:hypothetical protein